MHINKTIAYSFILILLQFFSGVSVAQTVTRGPYLQAPAPNSITVRWRTDVATDSSVSFALLNGIPSNTSATDLTTEH